MQLQLRWDRYNPVHSVGLITTGLPGCKPNLWVGLRWSTEFFPGCSSARKETEAVEKVSQGCGKQGMLLMGQKHLWRCSCCKYGHVLQHPAAGTWPAHGVQHTSLAVAVDSPC